jgi:hypothetical protein
MRSGAGFILLGRDGEVGFSLRSLAGCWLEAMRRSLDRSACASAHCGAVSDDPRLLCQLLASPAFAARKPTLAAVDPLLLA